MGTRSKKPEDKVFIIAHYFMEKSKQAKRNDFSNKKLQKLLFYAQAWSLALHKDKLFDEKFEAWIHGAVIPKVYKRYNEYGFEQIKEQYSVDEFKQLTEKETELLDEIWSVYGKYDALYLEILNHSEEPWQKARMGLPSKQSSKNVISEKDMKEYYGKKIKEAEKDWQKNQR